MSGKAFPVVIVQGQPLPMPRPRLNRYGGVFSGGKKIRAYKKAVAEAAVKAWARLLRSDTLPLKGRAKIEFDFHRTDRREPDWDNLAKAAQDALLGIAFQDDRKVVDAHVRRFDGCARGQTIITLHDMEAV